MEDSALVRTFEMLVERLSNVEAAIARQDATRAHDDLLLPSGTCISAMPYCGRPFQFVKRFDMPYCGSAAANERVHPNLWLATFDSDGSTRSLVKFDEAAGAWRIQLDSGEACLSGFEADLTVALGGHDEWKALKTRIESYTKGMGLDILSCYEIGLETPHCDVEQYLMECVFKHRHPGVVAVGMEGVLFSLTPDECVPERCLTNIGTIVRDAIDLFGLPSDTVSIHRGIWPAAASGLAAALVRCNSHEATKAWEQLSSADQRDVESARRKGSSWLCRSELSTKFGDELD